MTATGKRVEFPLSLPGDVHAGPETMATEFEAIDRLLTAEALERHAAEVATENPAVQNPTSANSVGGGGSSDAEAIDDQVRAPDDPGAGPSAPNETASSRASG